MTGSKDLRGSSGESANAGRQRVARQVAPGLVLGKFCRRVLGFNRSRIEVAGHDIKTARDRHWAASDEPGEIGQSIRIGISRDADRLLRFYLRDSPFVSGPRSLTR